jgi:hypothetical protein
MALTAMRPRGGLLNRAIRTYCQRVRHRRRRRGLQAPASEAALFRRRTALLDKACIAAFKILPALARQPRPGQVEAADVTRTSPSI